MIGIVDLLTLPEAALLQSLLVMMYIVNEAENAAYLEFEVAMFEHAFTTPPAHH